MSTSERLRQHYKQQTRRRLERHNNVLFVFCACSSHTLALCAASDLEGPLDGSWFMFEALSESRADWTDDVEVGKEDGGTKPLPGFSDPRLRARVFLQNSFRL
jgi:hypothetical protein